MQSHGTMDSLNDGRLHARPSRCTHGAKCGIWRSYWLVAACTVVLAALAAPARSLAAVANFDDLVLESDSFHNGDPGNLNVGESHDGSFFSDGALFNNHFEVAQFGESVFRLWSGWSYSNKSDTETPGFTNQYSAIPGHDASGTGNYGVAFLGGVVDATITLPEGAIPQSVRVTNTTYAYRSMVHGDEVGTGFVRQFGDDPNVPGSGNQGEPDFLLLNIIGRDATGEETGVIDFYLADYRFANNQDDYAVDAWEVVDLLSLAPETSTLDFMLTSSDTGPFGINTPNYIALDDLAFFTPTGPLGDTNGDGRVDILDLNNVRNHFGEMGILIPEDTDGNGVVDIVDLNNVRNNFGAIASSVPEPSGWLLLLSSLIAFGTSNAIRGIRRNGTIQGEF